MSLRDKSAIDVMNSDPVTVSNDMSISKVKNRMEENDLRAITVVDSNNRVKGAVGYRDLVRYVQFNPDQASLEKVMHNPPAFDEEDSLIDVADLRIESGRKMLVKKSGEKLEGIIGDREFREAFKDAEEFKDVSTRTLGSSEVIHVFEDDSAEKARHITLDRSVSRLPVLDENGNLTGIVKSTDFLRLLIPRERQSSGGTSKDSLQDIKMAGGTEKKSLSNVRVSDIMDRSPFTVEGHISGTEALEELSERDLKELIVVDDRYPESVLTVKDFIEFAADMKPSDTVLVQLIGLDVDEEKAAVHNKIETQLRGSLGRKLDRPEELSLHVKKSEKDGKKHRYEATMKLYSEYGITTVQSEAWDLLEVVDDCLTEMDRLIRDKKEKRKEH